MNKTLGELASWLTSRGLPCRAEGDTGVVITAVNTLEDATAGELSFLANPKYERSVGETKAAAVIVREDFAAPRPMNLLRTKDPYAAVTMLIVEIHGYRKHPRWGVHAGASVSSLARIGEGANIGPGACIDDDVEIGRRATIYPGCYIARGCRLGDDVTLYPNVVVYDGSILGDRVTIHAGSIIGEDGLGYAPVNGKWVKIPQVGRVVVADDVEIGANCTIDRATLGQTVIGAGSKFSNLIAIGHGTKIGEDCMFVAQVGLAGSVTVGRHVTIAGQAGVVGHVTIGDNVTVGAKAGVTNDVKPGITVLGQPAVPIQDCKRQVALVQHLPELKRRVQRLEDELRAIRKLMGPGEGK